MKTKLFKRVKQAASALLTALVICSIFSLFVVYYLSLIEQQNQLNARSQTWNMAIAISEAGIEEGLEHLNDNTFNLALAPWSYIGGSTYYRSNTLADGSAYTVYITNSMPSPVVVSRAYVKVGSFLSLSQNISSGFFAALGVPTDTKTVTRTVLVTCNRSSLFLVPLVAKKNINLNGNNISADSYASCDPAKSVNGQYAPGIAGDHGDVASNLGVIDSVSGGNANIYGHAHTGVNTNNQPTVGVGPNGGVGSHAWQANNRGIQDGWVLEDANFTFPDTTFPNTGGFLTSTGGVLVVSSNVITTTSTTALGYPSPPPASGVTTNWNSTTTATMPILGTYLGSVTANKSHGIIVSYTYNLITGYTYNLYSTNLVWFTNTYDHILWGSSDLGATNNYVADSLSGKTIVVGNNVNLALPNGLNMDGNNDSIAIMPFSNVQGAPTTGPVGAGVVVYSGGTSCAVSGNAVINQPGYPADFILYCAPTVTSFSLNGNGGFNGVLVAPSVDLTLNGGGTTPIDFVGAAMVNSATLNGHYHFHYDECLANYKNNPRFLITGWNEVH